jgi:hypothetical protein
LRTDEFTIGASKTGDNLRCGEADICTVQIRSNAEDLFRDFLLSQTSVGAGVAGFSTGVARGDALDGPRVVARRIEGMRIEHLFDVTHEIIFVWTAQNASTRPCPGRQRRVGKASIRVLIVPKGEPIGAAIWRPLIWLKKPIFLKPTVVRVAIE